MFPDSAICARPGARRRLVGAAAIFALMTLVALLPAPVAGQGFPARPLRIIVPLAPGGGVDITARAMAQRLSSRWGQPVVVDNRSGGTGTIGLEIAARAIPDGYTVTFVTGSHTARPATEPNLSYDLLRDLAPISQLTRQSYVLVLNPGLPVRSVRELLALAQERPGTLTYGSAGIGSLQHFSGALFGIASATRLLHVPYKGGGPALADVVAGHISMVFATPLESLPHIKGGRLRALAVTSSQRSPAMPDLPTIAESGAPGYEVTNWYGVMAPRATPAHLVAALHKGFVDTLRSAEITERLAADGVEPVGSSPEEFRRHIEAELGKWRGVVLKAGIKVQ